MIWQRVLLEFLPLRSTTRARGGLLLSSLLFWFDAQAQNLERPVIISFCPARQPVLTAFDIDLARQVRVAILLFPIVPKKRASIGVVISGHCLSSKDFRYPFGVAQSGKGGSFSHFPYWSISTHGDGSPYKYRPIPHKTAARLNASEHLPFSAST